MSFKTHIVFAVWFEEETLCLHIIPRSQKADEIMDTPDVKAIMNKIAREYTYTPFRVGPREDSKVQAIRAYLADMLHGLYPECSIHVGGDVFEKQSPTFSRDEFHLQLVRLALAIKAIEEKGDLYERLDREEFYNTAECGELKRAIEAIPVHTWKTLKENNG